MSVERNTETERQHAITEKQKKQRDKRVGGKRLYRGGEKTTLKAIR